MRRSSPFSALYRGFLSSRRGLLWLILPAASPFLGRLALVLLDRAALAGSRDDAIVIGARTLRRLC
ncbi:hypothetical protein NFI95_14795 [Acetobacteraceae bacterium KSS8]|uniref:Uncharacterized protein n=1 Tax=Endosaccharibacter trunci TaxID=2812733 RepID=A0ABT1WA02_9PROT|nr:hypothetical protein [Acetobacteraceae bacterium KSS8]